MKKNSLKRIMVDTYFVLGFALIFSMNVNAYIDPSVMTYAIQAIVGIVIAVSATIGIYFRKIKKKVNNKLGIDENKNKEVEDDNIEIISKKKNK